MKKWNTLPAFKALQDEWYGKLKEIGFNDIEREYKGEIFLKEWASNAYRAGKVHSETVEEKTEYYRLLSGQFSDEQAFEDDSDRLIMEKTCDGWTIAEISRELKERGWEKHNRDTIRYIRRRYETKWGIRQWPPEQMISRRVIKSS